MPPSAAPEWLRVGWSFDTIATSAPASWASIAARIPAQPAPITRTSCVASTAEDATQSPHGNARVPMCVTEYVPQRGAGLLSIEAARPERRPPERDVVNRHSPLRVASEVRLRPHIGAIR